MTFAGGFTRSVLENKSSVIMVDKSSPPTFLKVFLSYIFSSISLQRLTNKSASCRSPVACVWLASYSYRRDLACKPQKFLLKQSRMVECPFLQLIKTRPTIHFYFPSWANLRVNLFPERRCPGDPTKPCAMEQVCGWADHFPFLGLSFYFILVCVSCFRLLWEFGFFLQKKNWLG